MNIDGGCHCGLLTYKANVDPTEVFVCHCADCQSISGSPFRWAISVPEEEFVLLSGNPKVYVKIGDNGQASHQLFCPECASPLYSMAEGDGPKVFRLRLGTCHQRAELMPKAELWCSSSQSWGAVQGDTKRIEAQ